MKVLIFGGTTEGRKLAAAMSAAGIDITLSVATEYGKNIASKETIQVCENRLSEEGMIDLLISGSFDHVIDATHPYAVLVTKNIQSACKKTKAEYLRLKRPEGMPVPGVIYVPDMSAAVDILRKTNEKVLLTIGSKDLEPFTHINNFANRLYIRILPMVDSLEKALAHGFLGGNIICMQGPFDLEMNIAMLKMTGAKYLVTKDSGDAGGFEDKVSAALRAGCEVIAISRPVQEDGLTLDEILGCFNINMPQQADDDTNLENHRRQHIAKNGLKPPIFRSVVDVIFGDSYELQESDRQASAKPNECSVSAFFPLFIDICNRKVLVVGGGKIAERRVKTLLSFGAGITVIAAEPSEYIECLASQGKVNLYRRKYQPGEIAAISPFFVITATDKRQVNHDVMVEAASFGVPVSVADCRSECTCYFPAIAEDNNYIAGIVSKNGNHTGVKHMAEKIRGLLST